MKKMILLLIMVTASAALCNCSNNCNPCAGTCAPSDCSGTNSYTGNWY